MKFSKKDAFTVPNILTYIRLLCLPFFLWMMFAYFADREASQYLWAGFGLFVFASATDIADGWIARHFNMVSDIGKVLDPVADKLLQCFAMLTLGIIGLMHWAFIAIIIAKELYMLFSSKYFIEGSVMLDGSLYLLTWTSRVAFIYDAATLEYRSTYSYPRAGWGLTTDGSQLIASDGTSTLYFMDGQFSVRRRLTVRLDGRQMRLLNELEYIGGKIWANVYTSDLILIIDPETGKITVELPMSDYDAPEGEYTGHVVTYDQNDDVLGQYTFTFYYKPTPKLPNTGSVFANLNIARADYIITGLIFFGLVAGFAIYLIGRRSHRR